MINLEKEIREQPDVLAGIKAANEDTLRALVAKLKEYDPSSAFFAARGTSDRWPDRWHGQWQGREY